MKSILFIVAVALLAGTLCSCERENHPIKFNNNGKVGVIVSGTDGAATKAGKQVELISSTLLEDIDGQDFRLDAYVEDNDMMPFAQEAGTKGSIVTTEGINAEGKMFAINGWLRSTNRYPNDGSAGRVNVEADATNYHFISTTATKGSTQWALAQEAYWRNAVPTTFWSYYPVSDNARVLSLPVDKAEDAQQDAFSFTYTTPESVADQNDLLFAYNLHTVTYDDKGETEDSESIDIDFYHALAAIRFDVSGVENTTIDGVSFSGIAVAGTCNVTRGETATGGTTPGKVTFTWTPSATGTRSQALVPGDFTETGLDGETENALMSLSSSKFFFFIPQQIKDKGVKISITFMNLGKSVTKTVDLNHDIAWEAGKIYTYKLSVQGDVADAEVTATIETTYSENKEVTGSAAKLTLTKTFGTVNQWTLKNVKFSQNGVDFRSTASINVTSGTAVTIDPVAGKPYMPKTDIGGATYNWAADIYYTTDKGEHFLKTVTGTVNAPGPAADKFELKMNFDGYTNFSVAKGYDGQTKNVTKANNTDENNGGMDKETVYNVGGMKYVSGLSADVYTQCSSLLKCEATKYDGNAVTGTGVNYTKQTWAAHTISCYAEFDGISPNTQPSKTVHITGLPFYNKPPKNTGDQPWVLFNNEGKAEWGENSVAISFHLAHQPILQSCHFWLPENTDVSATGDITASNPSGVAPNKLWIKPNGNNNDDNSYSFNFRNDGENWKGTYNFTWGTHKDGPWIEVQYSHNIAGHTITIKEFNILYR